MRSKLGLVIVGFLACATWLETPSAQGPRPGNLSPSQGTANNQSGQNTTVVIESQNDQPSRAQSESEERRRQAEDADRKAQTESAKAQAYYAGVQTLLAVVGLLATGVLLYYTHLAFGLSKAAAESSERTIRIVERGYLVVDKATMFNVVVGQRPFAHLEFRNEGRAPLVVSDVCIELNILPNPPGLADPPVYNNQLDHLPWQVGPNCPTEQEIANRLLSPLTTEDVARILKGERHIYIWGRYTYHDGFTAGRVLRFAMLYDPHKNLLIHAPPASYHEYS